jgi:hypothetical protein
MQCPFRSLKALEPPSQSAYPELASGVFSGAENQVFLHQRAAKNIKESHCAKAYCREWPGSENRCGNFLKKHL